MRRVTFSGLALIFLVLASTALWQGCSLDPTKKPPIVVPPPVYPPESPKDVMDNVKYAYERYEPDRYETLIDGAFTFYIWSGDKDGTPGQLAPEGFWTQDTEVLLAQHMMDLNFVPKDDNGNELPDYQIDSMQMEWSFSDPGPVPSNLVGAPKGTMEAYVNFDLQVNTKGTTIFVVHSRPLFFFTPDSTVTPVTWTIYRVDDGENLNNPG